MASILKPLAFFSRKLNASEAKYSTLDRELLARVVAICHFRCLVEGRTFTPNTDHKLLTYLCTGQAGRRVVGQATVTPGLRG